MKIAYLKQILLVYYRFVYFRMIVKYKMKTFNLFQPILVFHITANQMTGFYMKSKTAEMC